MSISQDVYTRAIITAYTLKRVSFGSTKFCNFNLAEEFKLSKEDADTLINVLYNCIIGNDVFAIANDDAQQAFDDFLPYIKELAKCGTIKLEYKFNDTSLVIDNINVEDVLKLDLKNKLNLFGECELLPYWSNKNSAINISRYFNIPNTKAKSYLAIAIQYYLDNKFANEGLGYASECITHAIVYALQGVSYDKYVIKYHDGCILITSRSNSMEKININALSFTVDDNEISVDFRDNIITINNTDYTKEGIKNIINGLKEAGVNLDL